MNVTAAEFMKELDYQEPGRRASVERPKPVIKNPTDEIVRITKTTICATDPYILVLEGNVLGGQFGRLIAHDGDGRLPKQNHQISSFHGNGFTLRCGGWSFDDR